MGGLTDTNVHARPGSPPAFNATTKKAYDTTFLTYILRLTGAVGSNAVYEANETLNMAPIQHFVNPWNYTGDRFIIWADRLGTDGGSRIDLYSFNPTTFTATWVRTVASPVSKMNYNDYITWSRLSTLAEADKKWLLYAVDTSATPNAVYRWNLDQVSHHDNVGEDIGDYIHNRELIFSDAEGIQACTIDETEDYFAYWNNAGTTVKVYKKSITTTYTLDVSGWISFDEVQITPKGYVYVKGNHDTTDQVHRFNSDLTNPLHMGSFSPDYFAGKHSGYGTNWVNVSGEGVGYLAKRNPADGNGAPTWIWNPSGMQTQSDIHPSYWGNYVYGGIFSPYGYDATKKYIDEIVRVKDDGNEVLRLCHAWSNYVDWKDNIPSFVDPTENYVIFYSNWNGSGRHDVFIVQINATGGGGSAAVTIGTGGSLSIGTGSIFIY